MNQLLFLISALIFSNAQTPNAPLSDVDVISRQGNLLSIRVVKGEPIRIYVLGRQEAEVDLSGIQVDLSLDPSDMSINLKPKKTNSDRILKLKRKENYFVIENPVAEDTVYKLEVKTKADGKKETFKFKLKNKQP